MKKSTYTHTFGSKKLEITTGEKTFTIPYTPDLQDHTAVMSLRVDDQLDPIIAKEICDTVAADLST